MANNEAASRAIDERVEDLLSRLSPAEKAGLLFHPMLMTPPDGKFDPDFSAFGGASVGDMLDMGIRDFGLAGGGGARERAAFANALQAEAVKRGHGIPVTLSSDPLHHFNKNKPAFMRSDAFSQFPQLPGLAAMDDDDLLRQFADIARQEYLAVGLRAALHPMVDLATEPRWARIFDTFGEDAQVAARLAGIYIRGFQGESLGENSVACMTKHFPGGGPQKDGEDPHFKYGREQVYPGDNFDYHLLPFEAAFAAGTAMIMPYYGLPLGTDYEEVGFAYNKGIITGLLREKYGFDGVVCTDWGLLTDREIMGKPFPARAWGVEHLDVAGRAQKALDAGVDQFGGEECPEVVIALLQSGRISEARIDQSVRRLLRNKFRLGLFERPYVDEEAAAQLVGNPAFRAVGEQAQRKSIVLLKNADVLPLTGRPKLYIENIDAEEAAKYGAVVASPDEADFAILRLDTPYEARDDIFLESFMHAGDLDFKQPELQRILAICRALPTIVAIHLERPAVIPEISESAAGLLADFGASDAAALDIIFGRFQPSARLPFELPASMAAVQAQRSDVPRDSANPLYEYGFGLTY